MSYSGPVRIAERGGFTLDSYGNGAAYVFACATTGESLWLDGENAIMFRDQLDACERIEESAPKGLIARKGSLAWLWDECGYGMAAQ